MNSERKTDQAEASEKTFQLADLPRLIWKASDGSERDAWSSDASDFQTFVQPFGTVGNVDVTVWGVFDRLDYVNGLFTHCQENGFQFPFTVKPVEQRNDASA